MEEQPRPTDFVDYQAVFSEALFLVGKGDSVAEALETCLRRRYPHTYRDMLAEARTIISRLRNERGWGSLRALRELSNHPGLAENMRARKVEGELDGIAETIRHPNAIADYPHIFELAQRKRQTGFSLDDSLEMAVRELYPQTYRKVLDAARSYIRLAARVRGEHELRALRELAEDPLLFSRLEGSQPE